MLRVVILSLRGVKWASKSQPLSLGVGLIDRAAGTMLLLNTNHIAFDTPPKGVLLSHFWILTPEGLPLQHGDFENEVPLSEGMMPVLNPGALKITVDLSSFIESTSGLSQPANSLAGRLQLGQG